MADEMEEKVSRPSIASVYERVGRLETAYDRIEQRQALQEQTMELIKLEQTHIREIMTSRFVALENHLVAQGSKMDSFIGRMETLISESTKAAGDLDASPAGRLINQRLGRVEAWEQVSRNFHAEFRGMTATIRFIVGSSLASAAMSVFAILKVLGVIQ